MPIFEFDCLGCRRRFDELVRSDADLKILACPHCRGRKHRRVMSGFALAAGKRAAASGGVRGGGHSCGGCRSHSCGTCKH